MQARVVTVIIATIRVKGTRGASVTPVRLSGLQLAEANSFAGGFPFAAHQQRFAPTTFACTHSGNTFDDSRCLCYRNHDWASAILPP